MRVGVNVCVYVCKIFYKRAFVFVVRYFADARSYKSYISTCSVVSCHDMDNQRSKTSTEMQNGPFIGIKMHTRTDDAAVVTFFFFPIALPRLCISREVRYIMLYLLNSKTHFSIFSTFWSLLFIFDGLR